MVMMVVVIMVMVIISQQQDVFRHPHQVGWPTGEILMNKYEVFDKLDICGIVLLLTFILDEIYNFISAMFLVLVFGLLFYVKNDWCDLLFKNFTVSPSSSTSSSLLIQCHHHDWWHHRLQENRSCAPRHFQKKGGTLLGRTKLARRVSPDGDHLMIWWRWWWCWWWRRRWRYWR